MVPLTKSQRRIVREFKEHYLALLQDDVEVEIKTAMELVHRVSQTSNGWFRDDERTYYPVESNKVRACVASVEELICAGERVLVWCAFRHDIKVLRAALAYESMEMLGGVPFDINRWKDSNTKVCFATEASGSSVNHFQDVAYVKYFSMSPRWFDLQQSMLRTDRKGSTHPTCHYEFFFTEGTFDRVIYNHAHSSGREESSFIKHGQFQEQLYAIGD